MKRVLGRLARTLAPKRLVTIWNQQDAVQAALSGRDAALQSVAGYQLRQRFPGVVNGTPTASDLAPHEIKVCSQHGEDGVLLHLFSLIGVTVHRFVEIGCGDGQECNTANLSLNFGWGGVLVDASPAKVALARRFYLERLGADAGVRIERQLVTAESINDLMRQCEASGELDLLSIDIDGNDYWVWRALTAIQPRIVVIEYNASFGPEVSVTIPYRPDFSHISAHPSRMYHGASLAALAKLGREKGYALVGCESSGANAFFVRRELLPPSLPEVTARAAFRPARGFRRGALSLDEQQRMIANLPLVQV